jgi:aminopeptidase-like protein
MGLVEFTARDNLNGAGEEMYRLIAELYPVCRSITGDGFRKTLNSLKQHIPIEIHEVPTGTEVLDWTVPREWNIRQAYIKNAKGEKIVDFAESNLHVVSYSTPVCKKLRLDELKNHLFTLPDYPDRVPYKTSYYKESWGFCLSYRQWLELKDEEYEVLIDASLEPGSLTYGELFIKGKTSDEILISCHGCHPSLCNDNLSGMALVTFLAKTLMSFSLRYSYRFLFVPVTIGAITWLALNEHRVDSIKHGLVAACVGDPGKSTYKKSRRGDAEIDKAVIHVLKHSGTEYEVMEFSPYGYDERQYCSPGFNLPVGCLMRTPSGCFPEYHNSGDNLGFVQPLFLADSFTKVMSVFHILENNKKYLNLYPKGEPQLGRKGLYQGSKDQELALLWVLNLSDGNHTLLDIADRAGMKFTRIQAAADALLEHRLIRQEPAVRYEESGSSGKNQPIETRRELR